MMPGCKSHAHPKVVKNTFPGDIISFVLLSYICSHLIPVRNVAVFCDFHAMFPGHGTYILSRICCCTCIPHPSEFPCYADCVILSRIALTIKFLCYYMLYDSRHYDKHCALITRLDEHEMREMQHTPSGGKFNVGIIPYLTIQSA